MFDLIIMLSRYLFIFYIVLFLWQGIVSLLYPRIRNAVMCINTVIRLCMETAV